MVFLRSLDMVTRKNGHDMMKGDEEDEISKKIEISLMKTNFLSSAYVVSPGPTSHKKLSCGLFVTFQ